MILQLICNRTITVRCNKIVKIIKDPESHAVGPAEASLDSV